MAGVGKLTSPLPTNANILSATSRFPPPFPPDYDVSLLPAGGERKVAGRALALAGSGDVNLPIPKNGN
jgi:hypothetical protein